MKRKLNANPSILEIKQGRIYLDGVPLKYIQNFNLKAKVENYPYVTLNLKLICLLKRH